LRLDLDKIKIAVALRMARAAVGWSQEEAAQNLGVAKTTIARLETGETNLSAEKYFHFQHIYQAAGIGISLMQHDQVTVTVSEEALDVAKARLADASLRRADRVKPTPSIERLGGQKTSGELDER